MMHALLFVLLFWILSRYILRTFSKTESPPDLEKSYLEKAPLGPTYCFLDIEKRGNQIQEIALLQVRGENATHFTWSMDATESLPNFMKNHLNPNQILIGHNIIDFDIPNLQREFPEIKDFKTIDTLHLSRFLFPFLPSHRLFDLLHYLDIDPEQFKKLQPHNALDDVKATELIMSSLAETLRQLDKSSLGLLKRCLPAPSFEALLNYCGESPGQIEEAFPDVSFYEKLFSENRRKAIAPLILRQGINREQITRDSAKTGISVYECNDIHQSSELIVRQILSKKSNAFLFKNVEEFRNISLLNKELLWLAPWIPNRENSFCLEKVSELLTKNQNDGWQLLSILGIIRAAPYPNWEMVNLIKRVQYEPRLEDSFLKSLTITLLTPKKSCSTCEFSNYCGRSGVRNVSVSSFSSTPENFLSRSTSKQWNVDNIVWINFHPLANDIALNHRSTINFPSVADTITKTLEKELVELFSNEFYFSSTKDLQIELELFRRRVKEVLRPLLKNHGKERSTFWQVLLETPLDKDCYYWVNVSLDPFRIELRSCFLDLCKWMRKFLSITPNITFSGMGLGLSVAKGQPLLDFLFGVHVSKENYCSNIKRKGTLTLYTKDVLGPPGRFNQRNRVIEIANWIRPFAGKKNLQIICGDKHIRQILEDFLNHFYPKQAIIITEKNWHSRNKPFEKVANTFILLSSSLFLHEKLEECELYIERLRFIGPQSVPWSARLNCLLEKSGNNSAIRSIITLSSLKSILDLLNHQLKLAESEYSLSVHLLDSRWENLDIAIEEILNDYFEIKICKEPVLAVTDIISQELLKEWILSKFPRASIELEKARTILTQVWGYRDFKDYGAFTQWDVIRTLLNGEDFFLIVSTGGGKSVCFQIPALYLQEDFPPLLTLVISPLMALMEDQVQNLHKRGIFSATFINSSLSYQERQRRLLGIRYGLYSLVYIAPEQLRNEKTVNAILHRDVGLLVVDEAHSLSEWGHNFRTDYFYIKPFIEEKLLKGSSRYFPILAATATAKAPSTSELRMASHTRADIIANLNLDVEENKNFMVADTERTELQFSVVNLAKGDKELCEKLSWEETDRLKKGWLRYNLPQKWLGKKGIIYCAFAKTTEDIYRDFEGIESLMIAFYNGKMEANRKKEVLEWFRLPPAPDKVTVLVATNAFGMGIDIPDIGFVIHYDPPASLESYFQEAGRACRDTRKVSTGYCVLLYHPADLKKQRMLSRHSEFSFREINFVWEYLLKFNKDKFIVPLDYLSSYIGLEASKVKQILFYLEYRSKYTLEGQKKPLLRLKSSRKQAYLLEFYPSNKESDPYLQKLKTLIKHDNQAKGEHWLELHKLAKLWNLSSIKETKRTLKRLEREGKIRIKPQSFIKLLRDWKECEDFLTAYAIRILRYLEKKGAREGRKIEVTSKDLNTEGLEADLLSLFVRGFRIIERDWIDPKSLKVRGTSLEFVVEKFDRKKLDRVAVEFKNTFIRHVSQKEEIRINEEYPLHSSRICHLNSIGFFDLVSILEKYSYMGSIMGCDFPGESLEIEILHRIALTRDLLDIEALYKKYDLDGARLDSLRRYAERVASAPEKEQDSVAKSFLVDYFGGREELIQPISTKCIQLDPEQSEVVNTQGSILVEGTAGCGKSEIIVHKIHYLKTQSVPMDSILVTAHSHNTMQNLRSRYKRLFSGREDFELLTVNTLGMRVIDTYWQELGFKIKPRLLLMGKAQELNKITNDFITTCKSSIKRKADFLKKILAKHDEDKAEAKIVERDFALFWSNKKAKIMKAHIENFNVHPFKLWAKLVLSRPPYFSEAKRFVNTNKETLKEKEVVGVLKDFVTSYDPIEDYSEPITDEFELFLRLWFEHYLMENCLLTFNDQILLALRSLEHDQTLRKKFQTQFDYTLVDEYQDLTPVQLELLDLVFGNANLTVLGDKYQALYERRKHNADKIRKALLKKRAAKKILLMTTYRSTTQIIRMAHKITNRNSRKGKLPISKIGDGPLVDVWLPGKKLSKSDDNSIYHVFFEEIFKEIQCISKNGSKNGRMNTILVTAYKLDSLKQFLSFLKQKRNFKIVTQVKLGEDPLKKVKYMGLRRLLETVHHLTSESILALFDFYVIPSLTEGERAKLEELLSSSVGPTKWIALIKHSWNNAAQQDIMIRLLEEIEEIEKMKQHYTMDWLIERLRGLTRRLDFVTTKQDLSKLFYEKNPHFMTSSMQQLSINPKDHTIDEWLSMVFGEKTQPSEKPLEPVLTVGNIHQIKGEEYSHVFVIGFSAPKEQKHLYVALTRAQRKAFLCFTNPLETKYRLKLYKCKEGKEYRYRFI